MPAVTNNVVRPLLASLTVQKRYTMTAGVLTITGGTFPSWTTLTDQYSRSWTNTPGYRAKKRSGTLPTNNLILYKFARVSSGKVLYDYVNRSYSNSANFMVQYNTDEWATVTAYAALTAQDPSVSLVTDASLINALHARLKGPEWNAAIFVHEAKSTLQMVTKTAKTVADAIFALKKGKFRKLLEVLGLRPSRRTKRIEKAFHRERRVNTESAARNAWLQMKYGWVPLLGDVKSAAETLAEQVTSARTTDPIKITTRVWRKTESSRSKFASGYGTAMIQTKISDSRRIGVSYTLLFANDFGSFGLLNPFELAWEALPLSFVVDWFLPIGNYIRSLDTESRFSFQKGYEGRKRTVDEHLLTYVPQIGTWNGGRDTSSSVWVHATGLTSLPALSLRTIVPKFDLNWQQCLTGLALMSQRLRA